MIPESLRISPIEGSPRPYPCSSRQATIACGCCELGINLFPEFRGAEVRFIYPQYLRALHQLLGASYFFNNKIEGVGGLSNNRSAVPVETIDPALLDMHKMSL